MFPRHFYLVVYFAQRYFPGRAFIMLLISQNSYTVPADDRGYIVPADDRSVIVPSNEPIE